MEIAYCVYAGVLCAFGVLGFIILACSISDYLSEKGDYLRECRKDLVDDRTARYRDKSDCSCNNRIDCGHVTVTVRRKRKEEM